jgi:hypothetical protein
MKSDSEKENIAKWRKRIDELGSIMQPFEDERSALKQLVLEATSQFKVGDIIEWEGKRGRVTEVLPYLGSALWVVQRILKDGSSGHSFNVYYWHMPKKVLSTT